MKKFTLIELIVIIAIIAIMASLVIPNIQNMKQNAMKAEVASNIQHIQTAVDMFYMNHNSQYPTFQQPTIQNPQLINFDLLYPKYTKNLPNPSFKYLVDFTGKVWASSVEAPYNFNNEDGYLKWENNENAIGYDIYEVKDGKLKLIGSVKNNIVIKKLAVSK